MTRRATIATLVLVAVATVVAWRLFDRPSPPVERDPTTAESAQAPTPAPAPEAPGGAPIPPAVTPAPPDEAADTAVSRRDLGMDEARGGHTVARHVGRTDDDLRTRLRNEPRIAAASTWDDLPTAERIVGAVISGERDRIARWSGATGPRPNLALDYRGRPGVGIGRTLRRGQGAVEPCTDAVVVLRWDNGRRDYFVLTSYPEIRR